MDTVKIVPLIQTTLTRRGAGRDDYHPERVITQYWDFDGKLVAENDPASLIMTPERRFAIFATIRKFLGDTEPTTELIRQIEAEMSFLHKPPG